MTIRIGEIPVGGGAPLVLIAGLNVIETEAATLDAARSLQLMASRHDLPLVFKASVDKANRSSLRSYRGPGFDEGLRILARIKAETGLPLLTDVHEPGQAKPASEVVDCLQIPAFLCRQTDLLLAAARTGKAMNVKKGQFLAPEDMANVVAKLQRAGTEQVLITERGVSFGYHTLVVDFTGFPTMRATGQPLVFDATHAVQRPGGQGQSSGGDRSKVPYLARAAVACGIDGLFMEVHEDPDRAPSDGPNMLPLSQLRSLLECLLRIRAAALP